MKQIGQLDITGNRRLILSIGEYHGAERIDLRQYVKVNGKYIPTEKGINFNAEWLDGFLKMVKKLENE